MTRKYLSRPDWKRIAKREDRKMYISEADFTGNIHFLKMLEVSNTLLNTKFEIPELIVNDNYSWILFMPDNEFYVIIGQFDNNDNLIQIYVDIINDSGLENDELYYDDIYIDVILHYDKKVLIDDEDELKEALKENIITNEQYQSAYKTAITIYEDMKSDPDKWMNLVNKYHAIMKNKKEI